MKKLLVLCDRIPPEQSATGNIEYHIAETLSHQCEVYLVALSQKHMRSDNGTFHIRTCADRYGRYQGMIDHATTKNGLARILCKLQYHLYYAWISKRGLNDIKSHEAQFLRICEDIIEHEQIDTMLSVSNPFDIQVIAAQLSERHKNISWYAHLMDSNRYNAVSRGSRTQELATLKRAKKIFIVPALSHDADFVEDFSDRVQIVDIPIIPSLGINRDMFPENRINLVFSGLFYRDIRNPEVLLKIMMILPNNWVLHLYTRGCKDVVDEYVESLGERLSLHAQVPSTEIADVLSSADILVNIGNTVSNQVPSKVYEYIACGKPILNFYQNADDLSLLHLEKYPCALNLPYNDSLGNAEKIRTWFERQPAAALDYEQATNALQKNRLSSVSELIYLSMS